jgi:hypothetical protein
MIKIYINSAVELIDSTIQYKTSNNCKDIELTQFKIPDLTNIVTSNQARRLSKILKASLYTSTKALANAKCTMPDGILTATGLGCLDDTEKFLEELINNKEDNLSPTAFIHSTHNTISGQIAILLKCTSINNTYSQRLHSWETTLLDAFMILETEPVHTLLVNAVDENTPILNQYKNSIDTSLNINLGEHSISWVLSNEQTNKNLAVIDSFIFLKKEMIDIEISQWINENIEIQSVDNLYSNINLSYLKSILLKSSFSMTNSAVYMQQVVKQYYQNKFGKSALYINHFNTYHTLIVFNDAK